MANIICLLLCFFSFSVLLLFIFLNNKAETEIYSRLFCLWLAGSSSTAAYKRWEKAAIAGVSLVADAAEHLERTTIDKDVGPVQNSQGE